MSIAVRTIALSACVVGLALTGCAPRTDHIPVVQDFDTERYMGTWYEIARLDHSFERGLQAVTATYRLEDDGTLSLTNRGYQTARDRWRDGDGRGRQLEPGVGHFSVQFFWPFRAEYRVIALDEDYQWAMVTSKRMNYLWILSRTPEMDRAVRDRLVLQARAWGFAVEDLIWVRHDGFPDPPRDRQPTRASNDEAPLASR